MEAYALPAALLSTGRTPKSFHARRSCERLIEGSTIVAIVVGTVIICGSIVEPRSGLSSRATPLGNRDHVLPRLAPKGAHAGAGPANSAARCF
jgi:hypothetical protein